MNRIITLKDTFNINKQPDKEFPITQSFGWTKFAHEMWERYIKTGKKLYIYGIHTGLDLGIKLKLLQSPIDGVVVVDDDANDSGRGIALSIWDESQLFALRFYHLKENFLYEGQYVHAGQDIAISGRSAGKLTVGNEYHAHIEGVITDSEGKAYGNYGGAVDLFGANMRWIA